MVRTLNKLSDLRKTKYGQPPPRHGLNLLWWFAHYCVQIDSNGRMIAKYNPTNGAFGFHRFYNKDRLLPYTDLPYYEVGNLHSAGSLPYYVTKNYTGHSDKSNKDRIIVSFDSRLNKFEKMYVTQHSDLVHFDQNHTYCISIDLLKNIQDLSREELLRGRTNRSEHISIDIPQSAQIQPLQSQSICEECCALLTCALFTVIIIAAILWLLKQWKYSFHPLLFVVLANYKAVINCLSLLGQLFIYLNKMNYMFYMLITVYEIRLYVYYCILFNV